MAIDSTIRFEKIDKLFLDPRNPRLGRRWIDANLSQDQVLDQMKDWTLDELAVSFVENGYWPQEALIVVSEKLPKSKTESLVVVEGNRRLASLKQLQRACNGEVQDKKWKTIADSLPKKRQSELFGKIPYIIADNRPDVESFLGFRHVTGIQPWHPAEKAQYIALMLEDAHTPMTYREVARKIGSKAPTVRQLYITYNLLLQMEKIEDKISIGNVEDSFSVLYLSLGKPNVKEFLDINLEAEPREAQNPVPKEKVDDLIFFARSMFGEGKEKKGKIVQDSRHVGQFAAVLSNPDAIAYLKRSETPNLEFAYNISGGGKDELIEMLQRASDNISLALSKIHHFPKDKDIEKIITRLNMDFAQLLKVFPQPR